MRESEGLYRSFRFLKKALIGLTVVIIGLVAFGYLFFMRHVDAPKAWAAAERELQGGMLHFGETVIKKARVFMRRPSDYFRGANGMLYATNERLIFIGIAPGDNFEDDDSPPVVISMEFPNDTSLVLDPARLFFFTAHGVKVSHPSTPPAELATIRGQEPALDSLVGHVNAIHLAQRREADRERKLRAAVTALIGQPLYYTVKRGDAIFSIARKFDATDAQIREWNQIVGDRIRIGQRLLVKPEKK
ncbi:MAG TPA: LysM peptidoglycan-binding domain-containing protein [Gemmatimonadaceae bacterium]|nr:LysM peptidoglycan-binding domain-containing protein [Gemmatimonadaceae bacterium]